MPVFMAPDRWLTGQQPAGARPLARGLAHPSLMQRGGEPHSWCSWHLFLLLWIYEDRAPRLAVRDQPSPSKPVIPRRTYYTRNRRHRKAAVTVGSLVGQLLLHVFWDLPVYAPMETIPCWVT